MSQHDMNIANQGFPAFRADLNDALGALVSNSSGATAPSTTFAHQFWVDTAADPSVLKIRNADNDAWITIGEIDQTGDKFNLTCANATISENLTLNAQGDLRFADSDSSNWVAFQAPATVASNVTWTLPATDGTSGQALTTDGSGTLSWAAGSPENGYNFRNRIINGDMRIDQRNAGAAVTASGSYPVDRFVVNNVTDGSFSAQQDSSAPSGFINSIKFTTTTADASLSSTQQTSIAQRVEGTNVSDLGWGTANAKTVTLSFWVRSSLTGTFGGALRNSAADRSYPFTYSVSTADTWEYKTVTVAGDTSGTWLTTTAIGINVFFGLGAGTDRSGTAGAWNSNANVTATGAVSVIGTLNATWYITGVQLEVGSVATPFERRPYGTELALCQRYYQHYVFASGGILPCAGVWRNSTRFDANSVLPVVMRATPTIATVNVGNINVYSGGSASAATTIADNGTTSSVVGLNISVASGGTEGRGGYLQSSGATAGYTLSIEL